jgi:hypothetical protein
MIMSETTNWKETEMELIETDLPELPRRGERFKYFGTVPSQRAKDAPTPVFEVVAVETGWVHLHRVSLATGNLTKTVGPSWYPAVAFNKLRADKIWVRVK